MLTNDLHKQAAKAALARTIAIQGSNVGFAALVVCEAATSMGLQLGDLSTVEALSNYGWGVQAKGEKVANRGWANYPPAVAKLATDILETGSRIVMEALA